MVEEGIAIELDRILPIGLLVIEISWDCMLG